MDRENLPCVVGLSLQFGHAGEGVETMPRNRTAHIRSRQLQFGHAGEGVETSRYDELNRTAEAKVLQFGHAGEGVETSLAFSGAVATRPASIRPRR